MNCRLIITKPQSQHMLVYCQLNKSLHNLTQDIATFIHEYDIENVVFKIAAILSRPKMHHGYVIMRAMVSGIAGVWIVCTTVCLGADQKGLQSSESLAFVRGIHRWPVGCPHKGLMTRKMFPFDDVIMCWSWPAKAMKEIDSKRNNDMVVSWQSLINGVNMGPTWGRQDPGRPHVGPMDLAIWECYGNGLRVAVPLWG